MLQSEVQNLQATNSGRIFMLQSGGRTDVSSGNLSFFLTLSTDLMRPTHIMEDNMLHLKCIDLNISHI